MALDEAKVAALASAFAPGGDRSRTLIELLHSEAVDCATFRFDHDGTARRRTRTFETEVAGLIKAQVGSGKSHKSHREIAQVLENQPDARIAFLTSTIDLGAQSHVPLEAVTDLPWLVYRGFEAKIDGVPICKFIEQAIAARRIGLDPYEVLCPGCPHQSACPLWAQFNDPNPRVITTHAMLRHGLKPYDTRAPFDLVVIDEDPTSTLLADETYALSLLINVRCEPKTRATLEQLLQAATAAFDAGGRILIKDLPRAKALRSAASSLRKKASIKISRDTLPDAEAIAGAEARLRVAALLDDMIDAMAMTPGPRGEVGGCMVRQQKDGALAFKFSVARDIHPQFAGALAVQVLSATAQLPLLERSIPNIQLYETPWQPHENGKFVFVQGAKTSKYSLLEGAKLAAGGLEALEVIRTLARRHGRVFLACQKPVLEALAAAGLPSNVATRNFGALEGLNEAAQFDAAIILGRPLPPVAELILQAETAAGGFIDAELIWTDKEGASRPAYGRRVTLERTATDGSIYTAYDYRHEDRYINAARQASTFAAVAQSDRLRGQHRGPDNPGTIYDMTGLDNVWQIDEVVHWRSLCGWFGALEAMDFVPHPDAAHGLNALLAALLPEIFPDAKAVENHRVYAKRMRGITLDTLIEQCTFKYGVVVDIKLPGARYGVPVIVNASSAPEAADLIRQHLPPGTKISTKARHTMRLNQPPKEETIDDCIIYELAARSHALAAEKEAAGAPHGAGGCAEELVCEDGAAVPLRPGTG
jgi:hypothetical protein